LQIDLGQKIVLTHNADAANRTVDNGVINRFAGLSHGCLTSVQQHERVTVSAQKEPAQKKEL
jgi:hypothetical protein